MLYRIKYLRAYLDIKHLKILYYSLVQSQLTYGIIGWGGVNDRHLENLNVIHRWILRTMLGKPLSFSNDRLYADSGFLDVRQLFCLSMLLNIKRGKITSNPIKHSYSTRIKERCLSVPRCCRTIGQRHCDYLSPRLYGLLPSDIKLINNINLFKRKLKIWISYSGRNLFHDFVNQRLFVQN